MTKITTIIGVVALSYSTGGAAAAAGTVILGTMLLVILSMDGVFGVILVLEIDICKES